MVTSFSFAEGQLESEVSGFVVAADVVNPEDPLPLGVGVLRAPNLRYKVVVINLKK
jgi:hypothetical protein